MPKKVLVALPPGLLEQIDFVAQVEHRTRSDLIRESLRRYIEGFKRQGALTSPMQLFTPDPETKNPYHAAPPVVDMFASKNKDSENG